MGYHNFQPYEKLKDPISEEEYRQCSSCGAVMFEKGDDYFNLAGCTKAYSREDIRRRLQNDSKLK